MKRKIVSELMLTLLVISMLTLAFNIQQVKSDWTWTETIYIRADGSIHPDTAPISTVDNITYILTDNIVGDVPAMSSAIDVERDNIVVDGAGYTVQGTGVFNSRGIELSYRNNVTLRNVEVQNFTRGINLDSSNNNILVGNNVSNNNFIGINLDSSNNNILVGNNVSNNDYRGIMLAQSNNNIITGNTVSSNNQLGIVLWSYNDNNILFHNNLINNTLQADTKQTYYDDWPTGTIWDDGYPSGGNYWSDYNGNDQYSGSDQDQPGSDGIGDTPYIIRENRDERDNYPLMSPWTPPEHELVTSITAPIPITFGNSSLLNATVTNLGLNDEVNVELLLFINGTTVDSTTILVLQVGDSYTLSYLWTPTVDGTYNVTAHVPPLPEEGNKENNQATKFLTVDGIPPITTHDYDGLLHTENFTITLAATDDLSGVAETYYKINDDLTKWVSTDGHPHITTESANNTLEYWSVDNAGNEETHHVLTSIKLDKIHPPVASFTYSPTSPIVSVTVTFNASASYDPDGTIISYEWDFGDGETDSGEIVTHAYADEGTYTVTLNVTDNDDTTDTDTTSLTISAASTYTVGVKAGDWIKMDYTVAGWPSGTPRPEWLKVEILSVEGTTASVRVTLHMSDGTEQSDTVNVDVATGNGTFQGLSGFVIPANSKTGDSINMGGDGFTFNVTIDGETTGTYAGASRTVVYASFSLYGTELTYYWDKQTGVMVESSTTSGGMTGTARATETNIWEVVPSPLWMQWWFYAIVAVVIVALVGAVYFLKKRKAPIAPTLPPEGTETSVD